MSHFRRRAAGSLGLAEREPAHLRAPWLLAGGHCKGGGAGPIRNTQNEGPLRSGLERGPEFLDFSHFWGRSGKDVWRLLLSQLTRAEVNTPKNPTTNRFVTVFPYGFPWLSLRRYPIGTQAGFHGPRAPVVGGVPLKRTTQN